MGDPVIMQVIVSATSSKVEDLILIETTTTIGDQVTSHRTGYDAAELMDNRFLSGDLETRIEALRLGAEAVTVRAVEAHFKTLMKVLQKEPEVTEVVVPESGETGRVESSKDGFVVVPEVASKKTRAKKVSKGTPKEILEAADKIVAFETPAESK
jgi:hypothetical protein